MKVKIFAIIFCLLFIINSISFAQISSIIGDTNRDGDINIIDALLVSQYYVGLEPSPFYEIDADVDCNDKIDITDALRIAQYYVNLIEEFTGCYFTATGTIRFVDVEGGCWKIETDVAGISYEPFFPAGFVPIDGLRVRFTGRIMKGIGSICQVGIIIQITEIQIGF